MSEYIKHEPSAREIAKGVIARSGHRIPEFLRTEITELLTDAAHDGLEFGESYAAAMDNAHTPGIVRFTQGYLAAINDIDNGQITEKEGEA
ncbi:MAG: hypothetical protein M3Q36_00810 [bacterium]|nr:hypothetical protein [bacterium]